MNARFTARILLSLGLLAGSAAAASPSSVQSDYLEGRALPSVEAKAPNGAAVQAAREIQTGPRSGESPQAYGLRARAAGLGLGLTARQADQAREFYERRALMTAAPHSAGVPFSAGYDPKAQANARARTTALMRSPGWRTSDASAFAAFSRAEPPARAPYRPGFAPNAGLSKAFKPRPAPIFVPAPSAKDRYYRQSAATQARASAITEKSSGDSASAWFHRKGLELKASYYGLMGFVHDPAAQGKAGARAVDSYQHSLVRNLSDPLKSADFLIPGMVMVRPIADWLAGQMAADAKGAYRSTKKASGHFSFWTAADATASVGQVGLDLASVTPAGLGRTAARESVVVAEAGAREGLAASEAAAREGASAALSAAKETAGTRPWLAKSGLKPEVAALLEKNYRRIEELNELYMRRKIDGAPREELDALRRESWALYDKNKVLQTQMPALREYFAHAAPGAPASREVMEAAAANMGVPLETMPKGVRLAGRNSLGRDIAAGGVLPNPGKALTDGTITGTGAHLLRDGSPHMVSVADRLTGGAVLLMTGFADASREKKTMAGIMYEFEQLPNAARVPPTREVFTDALTQGESVVPEIPLRNIRRVRSWRAELNPARPSQLIFRYTEPLALNPGEDAEAILAELDRMPHGQVMRVDIPGAPDVHIRR